MTTSTTSSPNPADQVNLTHSTEIVRPKRRDGGLARSGPVSVRAGQGHRHGRQLRCSEASRRSISRYSQTRVTMRPKAMYQANLAGTPARMARSA